MFVRTKKVKQYNYAYMVSNKWTRKGARQKVSRYLGRIHEPEQVRESSFSFDFTNSRASETISELVGWVLSDHGFAMKGMLWEKDGITVNPATGYVRCAGRPCVLRVNGDFMCTQTLRKLLRWTSAKDRTEAARELAKSFISAGIPVPQDVFIDVFMKSYNQGQSYIE